MKRSENINELAAALSKAQGGYKELNKNRTAKVKTKSGIEYSYNYADLFDVMESVKEALSSNSLALTQCCSKDERGDDILETFLLHSSGQFISNSTPILAGVYGDGGPQAFASSLTYARRYGACALLSVVAEDDDDGTGANDVYKNKKSTPTPPTSPVDNANKTNGQATPTQPQIKRLYAICHESNWTEENLKTHMKKVLNIESVKDLTWLQYDNLCKVIQATPKLKEQSADR